MKKRSFKGARTHSVLVDVHGPQVGIEQQPLGLQIDRRLPAALVAQGPLRVDETPEGGTFVRKRKYKNKLLTIVFFLNLISTK